MQARGETLAPGIIFDSDLGRDMDTVAALCMLYGLGRGRLLGVGIHYSSLDAASFCDAVARFYGIGGGLPIGVPENGPKLPDTPMLKVPLAMKNEEGQPLLRHVIRSITDTGDPTVVFRNALLTQQDKQGFAMLAGPATNFARTLELFRAREVVTAKVRLLIMAAGSFSGSAADPRIRADIGSARKLLAEWPSPVVAVGIEAGETMPFPAQSIDTDFASIPNHPLVAAFRAHRAAQNPQPAGFPSQAVLAALYAANPGASYFTMSPPGTIDVSDDGRTRFKESPNGNHRYLIVDPAQKETITKAFIALAATRPAAGRGGPQR